jgi:AraC-like DNA-binding protein
VKLYDDNKIFNEELLQIILNMPSWRIVSSLFPAEEEEVVDAEHAKWLVDNSHCHEHLQEVMICLKGESVASHRGKCYLCKPGTVFMFDKMEMHDSFYHSSVNGAVHLWLSFVRGAVLTSLISIDGGIYTRIVDCVPVLQFFNSVNLFNSTWLKFAKASDNKSIQFKSQNVLISLLGIIFELIDIGYEMEEKVYGVHKRHKQAIELIKEYIIEIGGSSVDLDDLAKIAGYSKSHFLRIFKQEAGLTVHSFINQERVKVAENMLNNGYLKTEISEHFGFSSASVFSRWCSQYLKKMSQPSHRNLN